RGRSSIPVAHSSWALSKRQPIEATVELLILGADDLRKPLWPSPNADGFDVIAPVVASTALTQFLYGAKRQSFHRLTNW
ncbi:MAG TPA: hypothetical protein PKI69_05955, partial [Rhodocyclaceae bacterium]|nr:hypothetical protein [Rhodocyclaceae bacterium]